MAADAEYLRQARANYCQSLAELSDPAARKVTYTIGGRSMDWTGYQRFLIDGIKSIDAQLASEADGNAEVISVIGDGCPGYLR